MRTDPFGPVASLGAVRTPRQAGDPQGYPYCYWSLIASRS